MLCISCSFVGEKLRDGASFRCRLFKKRVGDFRHDDRTHYCSCKTQDCPVGLSKNQKADCRQHQVNDSRSEECSHDAGY